MGEIRRNPNFKREMGRPENSREWQRVAGATGRAAISANAPVDFGTLAGSIYSRVTYDGTTTHVEYRSGRPYATFQEVGTGLYGPMHQWITPKRAQFLRWTSSTAGQAGGPGGGNVHFAKRVRGVKPRRYFYKGLVEVFGAGNVKSHHRTGGKPGL